MSFLQTLFPRNGQTTRKPHDATPEGRLRGMFDAATSIVVLTGPGLSGIGGTRVPADDAAAQPIRFRHFLIDPDARLEQWRRSLAAAAVAGASAPNRGHGALVSLARTRRLKVVTQCMDGLHLRAGQNPGDLVELHGQGDLAACTRCAHRTPLASHAAAVAAGVAPTCERDGAILKPAVTLFGETPMRSAQVRAEEWAHSCDLFVVAGTSLAGNPAASLVEEARGAGSKVALVSSAGAAVAPAADLVVEGNVANVLAGLVG